MTQQREPLATRMRPKTLDDIVGQHHLVGDQKILRLMVESGRMQSLVLYGPPGTGKTSIAHALSHELNIPFGYFNAGAHTKKDLQDISKKGTVDRPVVVLIDEIHRLDKTKQDFLLMQLEEGSLIMVGATTDNPYISMNPALRSRSTILELTAVELDDIVRRLKMALTSRDGLYPEKPVVTDEQLRFIAGRMNGDLRGALNALELAVLSTKPDTTGNRVVSDATLESCLQARQIEGDADGDAHYNLLSAFQKSIRGSDVDASLHYLARLIHVGDLVSIHRRLLVIVYEDIGLANPSLTSETVNAIETSKQIGLPEARITLGYIVTRLALSPKSNAAYNAINHALRALTDHRDMTIPRHLHDTHYKGASELDKGKGYKYPHDYVFGITRQNYLPVAYQSDRYLTFRDDSDTPEVKRRYERINSNIKESR